MRIDLSVSWRKSIGWFCEFSRRRTDGG